MKVDRSTKWGNPFPVSGFGQDGAVERFRVFAAATARLDPTWLAPLRGRDLACWCKPGEPCHADVLIEIANAEPHHG